MTPYDALAAGYDEVMAHVDYERWAAYLHRLLKDHGDRAGTQGDAPRIVELGGGTGTLALKLQPRGEYDYLLTDGSEAMLDRARTKIERAGEDRSRRGAGAIRCAHATFTGVTPRTLGLDRPADAVVLVYDGLNYLLDSEDVATLFERVAALLRPGGLFLFDQSTPANSQDNAAAFVDEGTAGDFSYVRESSYDPETRRHVTTFDLTVDGTHVRERHVQRAYLPGEIRALLRASPLTVEAAYDGFTTEPAHQHSHRVHWVARLAPLA
jgi:SAM-dependent methyltransferase